MAEIRFKTKDYPEGVGGSAVLDLCVEGDPEKPSGLFNRRVQVYLGEHRIHLTHHEWGISLEGGRKLMEAYLAARPSFGHDKFKQPSDPMPLVRFVERAIRRHVARSGRAFRTLLETRHEDGKHEGREEAQAEIRKALGIEA